MFSAMDPLRLNEKPIFQELRNSLPDNIKDTRNILEIYDNVLYVWNAKEFCVMTLNLSTTREKSGDVHFQKLRPTDSPIFEIKNLLINGTGEQLALWGNLGLVFMELPKRRGNDGMFQGGKEDILCAAYSETIEIQKAKWHPASTNDSHLLVLTSENTFRLYQCELGNKPKIIKSWKIGRVPFSSPSKLPDFTSLGETAVDFDFATPTWRKPKMFTSKDVNKNNVDWNQIEWPILVLRGNGEVLVVRGNILDTNASVIVSRPLSMYPPAVDNYGTDFCSIMCLQTTPPIVIIAMCTGKIYHAILLKDSRNEDDSADGTTLSQNSFTSVIHTPEEELYVYEYAEIELGLFFAEDDKKYSCPVHLRSDKSNKSRYFCLHNAGVHMINLPMVSQLEEYVSGTDENNDTLLPSLSNQSSSQYLICRRTKHTGTNEATPILGFGLLEQQCMLVALLHTGDVVSRSIIDFYYFPKMEPPELIIDKKEKINKEEFDVYIKRLLKRETSQPLIKMCSKTTSSRECLQLLFHATDIFRTEYFAKYDIAREEITKKVRALEVMKTQLLKELNSLLEVKEELKQTAERLALHYEDIKDEQEKLAQRAKEVLRLVNYKEPSMNPLERAEAEDLRKMEIKIKDMETKLKELKKKTEQGESMESSETTEKKTEIILSQDQEKTIKNSLGQMSKDIKELIMNVKKLENEVSSI